MLTDVDLKFEIVSFAIERLLSMVHDKFEFCGIVEMLEILNGIYRYWIGSK